VLEQLGEWQLHAERVTDAEMIWVASSEWPPSSKKSSWRPTRGTPINTAQSAASRVSTSPSGGT
jgi:hypothetical protein